MASCSPLRLGYDYADWFMFWKLDGFFSLTTEQKEFLHPQIDLLLAWHKTKELPLYVSLLRQVKEKAMDGLSLSELNWAYAQTERRVEQTMRRVAPNFSILLVTLKDQQIERFKQNFSQQGAVPSNDEKENPSEQAIKQVERWVGKLSDDQKILVIQLKNSVPDISKQRASHSEGVRNTIINFIAQDHTPQAVEQKILELYLDYEATYSEEYSQQVAAQRKAVKSMILGIDRILTPPQRAYFLTKIDLLVGDIESLEKKGNNRFLESIRRIVF